MPIISCPQCGKKLKLNTPLPAGKRLQCPECSARFVPDEGDDERPAREERQERVRSGSEVPERRGRDDDDDFRRESRRERRSRDDDDFDDDYDDRRPRRRQQGSNKALILWLSIGGGGLLVVGAVVLILLLTLGGGGPDRLMRDLIALVNEAADILETVKDRQSAKAAAARIASITERAESLGRRLKDLKLTPKEQEEVARKYESEGDRAFERMQRALRQAQQNSGGEPSFEEAVQRMMRVDMDFMP